MEVETIAVVLKGPSGDVATQIVRPAGGGRRPAVVVLQEGIGVTDQLLGVARRLAGDGYWAIVPDLYCRDTARKALTDEEVFRALPIARAPNRDALLAALAPTERKIAERVVAWFTERDTSSYLPDAKAALAFAREQPGVDASALAAIGFSLGGGLVGKLSAAGEALAAAVAFYGVPPSPVHRIGHPFQGHYASVDPPVVPLLAPFVKAMKEAGKSLEPHLYEGARHGFFNETRRAFDAAAATLAWQRTADFLRRHLARREEGAAAS